MLGSQTKRTVPFSLTQMPRQDPGVKAANNCWGFFGSELPQLNKDYGGGSGRKYKPALNILVPVCILLSCGNWVQSFSGVLVGVGIASGAKHEVAVAKFDGACSINSMALFAAFWLKFYIYILYLIVRLGFDALSDIDILSSKQW